MLYDGISDYRFPIKKILLLAPSTTCIILIPLIRDTRYNYNKGFGNVFKRYHGDHECSFITEEWKLFKNIVLTAGEMGKHHKGKRYKETAW
jgi:hypothetical protein